MVAARRHHQLVLHVVLLLAAVAPALVAAQGRSLLTSPIARCKTYTNCEAQPITTVQYCYTDAGCITGLTFGFAPTSKPPHTVACAKDCARSKNVTVAPGDVLTGYAISFQGSGAAKCANKVTFSSKKGRSYVADASAAPGAPSAAAAAASDNASPQTYVWRKSGSAPPAPVCLTHAQRPSTPFGTLCSVKKVKCSSGGALQGVHPVWGFQQQCGLTQQQAQWSVNAPPCPAGSSAPLAGAASTGVPNGTVSYTDPASGAAVTDVTCPMPGHVVTVAPVLADGNCTYPGDPITIQGTCPAAPPLSCGAAPTCTYAGEVQPLAPMCTTSDPNATVTFYVDGRPSASLDCPAAGSTAVITVAASYPQLPMCSYPPAPGLPAKSTCPAPEAAQLTCSTPPACQFASETIRLTGLCTTSLGGASVTYSIGGTPATFAACPAPGGAPAQVQASLSLAINGATCSYPDQPTMNILPSTCVAASAVTITCNNMPSCAFAGETVSLVGMCSVLSGPLQGATVTYKVNGADATSATCPAPGTQLQVSPRVVTPEGCIYTAAQAPIDPLDPSSPMNGRFEVPIESKCPDSSTVLARCRSVACTNANATVPLTGACTTTAPAASIGYLVNGAVALAATCPAPGVNLQVTAFITGVGGFPECSYNNTGGFVITSRCPSVPDGTVTCSTPRCRFAGDRIDLAKLCKSSTGGTVDYYTPAGAKVTTATCPAPGADGIVLQPRVVTNGCVSPFDLITIPASECPAVADAKITCGAPVTCPQAGATVQLSGSCSSPLAGAVMSYLVDGAPATLLTCPAPGVQLEVEPLITSVSGNSGCDYAGPSYKVTSTCPSAADAQVKCTAPKCSNPGQAVQLAGLCTSALAGATVVTTVDGKPATNLTCPNAGGSVSLQGKVTGYLGTCDYPSDPVPVTSACGATPPALTCGDVTCATPGITYNLAGHCSAGSSVAYKVSGNTVTSITCPPPGSPLSIDVVVSDKGCTYPSKISASSGCWLQEQVAPVCKFVSCKAGDKVDLAKANCISSIALPGASWTYAPPSPATCPANVTATLTAGTTGCSYQASFELTPFPPCAAGNYRNDSGTCVACGIGSYCPDGLQQVQCPADTTTNTTTATMLEDCTPVRQPCTPGYYTAPNKTCVECGIGYYCPDGIQQAPCSPGDITNTTTATKPSDCFPIPVVCTPGYYRAPNNTCVECGIGAYCPDGINKVPCGAGNTTSTTTATKPSDCFPIPVVCTPGHYPAPDNTCVECGIGSYCPDGINKVPCGAGNTTSTTTATKPTDCFPAPVVCTPGYYPAPNNTCVDCGIGSYCPDGIQQVPCGAGETTSTTTATKPSDCFPKPVVCTPGHYRAPNNTCVECGIGAYCPDGINQVPCGAGNTTSTTTATKPSDCFPKPVVCTPGHYPAPNNTCVDCGIGSYCPDGIKRVPCGAGNTTSTTTATKPTDCFPKPVVCTPGHYPAPNNTCVDCGIGSYCPDGINQVPCGAGETTNTTTATKPSDCFPEVVVCTPGFYPGDNGTCVECGYGFYCPDGKQQVACKDFYTTNSTTSTDVTQCIIITCEACSGNPSPAVYFTTGNDMTIWRTDAFTVGGTLDKMCFFQSPDFDTINDIAIDANGDAIVIVRKGSSVSSAKMLKVRHSTIETPDATRVCQYETLVSGGFPNLDDPTKPGEAWAGLGSGKKSNIMYGSSKNAIFTVNMATTPPTFLANLTTNLGGGPADITLGPDDMLYLVQNTQMFRIDLAADGITPTGLVLIHTNTVNMAGAFCTGIQPYATENSAAHKLVEMYEAYLRVGPMLFNPAGAGGFSGAATVPTCHAKPDTGCRPGYYPLVNGTCSECGIGSYCPDGKQHIPCGAGKITTTSVATKPEQCITDPPVTCTPGFYSLGNGTCEECGIGAYCPDGINQVPCGAGNTTSTTTATKPSDCFPNVVVCLPGQFLDTGSNSCFDCGTGYYCPDGIQRMPCGANDTTNTTTATKPSDCFPIPVECTPGYYRAPNNTCVDCGIGSYCPDGIKRVPCGAGETTSTTTATKPSDCFPTPVVCTPGYYRAPNNTCVECGIGSYCPDGIKRVPCNAGDTTNTTTATKPENCFPEVVACTPGQYLDAGNTCVDCGIGSYCPDGIIQVPCDPDHTTNTTTATKPEDCFLDCPPGQYPDNGACADCGYGYYCPDGKQRVACDPFYTTTTTNATAAAECIIITCEPCAGNPSPEVYFTTGNDVSIWRTKAFTVGGTLDKMCFFQSPDFDTINDIAIDANGDAIVIVRKGSSVSSAAMLKVRTSTLQTPDDTRVCEYETLISGGFPNLDDPTKPGEAWAGLGSGKKSNIMYGSSKNAIFTVNMATTPPTFLANLTTNLGGGPADITLGPDDMLYLVQNTQMFRIDLAADGITPTGLVLIHTNTVNMAGAFCTGIQPYATENSAAHKLVEMYEAYLRVGPMVFNPAGAGGFSGAATVPTCHAVPAGCRPGYYPLVNGTCSKCGIGAYCPDGKQRIACGANTTTTTTVATKPEQCVDVIPVTCTPGYYVLGNGTCEECGIGAYCTDGINQVPCGTGNTTNTTTATKPGDCFPDVVVCPPGQYLDTGSNSCFDCGVGAYCPDGIQRVPCSAGDTTNTSMATKPSDCFPTPVVCTPGYYRAPNNTCVECGIGSYCPDGINQEPCNAGDTTNTTTATKPEDCFPEVVACTPGYYPAANGTCVECGIGSYCPDGINQVPCNTGDTTNTTTATKPEDCFPEPVVCPLGQYLDGSNTCVDCGIGSYCPDGINQVPCDPDHTTNTSTATKPEDCFLDCPPGQYPDNGACADCGYGYYCPDGKQRVACDPFYTTTTTNATAAAECIIITCEPCAGNPSPQVYFTTGNDVSIWRTKAFTVGGTLDKMCFFQSPDFDTINDIAIDANGDAIVIVRKGSSVSSAAMLKVRTSTLQTPDDTRVCEYETLISGGFPNLDDPTKPGEAWAGLGSGKKSNIMYGSSKNAIFTVNMATTPPTFLANLTTNLGGGPADITLGPDDMLYLVQNTQMFRIDLAADGITPTGLVLIHTNTVNMAGAFCTGIQPYATENSAAHKLVEMYEAYLRVGPMVFNPAGAGGFSGAATVPTCHAVPAGCRPGYYPLVNGTCSKCGIGAYCPDGKQRIACGANTTTTTTVATKPEQCVDVIPVTCTPGYYVLGNGTCEECGIGAYCTDGINQVPCGTGNTTNTTTATKPGDCFPDVVVCPPGQYLDTGSNSCFDCGVGAYCPDGIQRVPCSAGDTTNTSTATKPSDCFPIPVVCTPGYYRAPNNTCVECGIGSYCPDGINQEPCNAGDTTNTATATKPEDCFPEPVVCPPGQYVDTGANTCVDCGIGSYCPDGIQQLPCATDYTTNTTTATKPEDCFLDCPPGKFPDNGTCADCGYGYYCSDGKQHVACDPFYTTTTTNATAAAECIIITCEPCAGNPSPEVYFTTGSDMTIWRTKAFTVGGTLDKMCYFNTADYNMINDIAIDANGDAVVIVRKNTVASAAMLKVRTGTMETPDPNRVCQYEVLISGGFPNPEDPTTPGDAWAGLGSGKKSNIMYGSSKSTIFTVDMSTTPPTFLANLTTGLAGGAADITLGPDDNLYLVQNTQMFRITLAADGITPTGLVNIHNNTVNMAGAFCTGIQPYATENSAAHKLVEMYEAYLRVGPMLFNPNSAGGFSGAATVPTCHARPTGCRPGYYRLGNGTCSECGIGAYCPNGVTQTPCTTGLTTTTTLATKPEQCVTPPAKTVTCTAGQYLSGGACVDCGIGSYCPDGITQVPCGAGNTTSTTTATKPSDCFPKPVVCTPGHYRAPNNTCVDCGIGSYCPDGINQVPCGAGNTTNTTTATKPSDCFPKPVVCTPGHYRAPNNTCVDCGIGSYCPNGTAQVPCATDYATNTTTATKAADCFLSCPKGKVPENGTCADCGYGSYCPDGKQKVSCAPFYTTNGTTATKAAECILSECTPCSGNPNPEVYFTTGNDMTIWRTKSFSVGGTLDKMCYFNTTDYNMINDIAIDANGDAIVIVRKNTVASAAMLKVRTSTLQTPDANRVCQYEILISGGFPSVEDPTKPGEAWAGLGSGKKSNIMYGSSKSAIFTVDMATTPPTFLANLTTGLAGGAADITLGPDDNLYLVQNTQMFRITLAADGITPTGLVNYYTNTVNMAGAFCTGIQPYATENSAAHKLVEMYEAYLRVGPMLFNPNSAGGFSGAATVPTCHSQPVTGCRPGYYPSGGGVCSVCGTGFYCPDGVARTPCAPGKTTTTTMATKPEQCV